MKINMTPFQFVILVIFGVGAAVGMLFFAIGGSFGAQTERVGPVLVWGTLDPDPINAVIQSIAEDDPRLAQVSYERKDERGFYANLSDAIASGRGPDLVIMSSEQLVRHANKMLPFSYDKVTLASFRESFVDGADLFLTEAGVIGMPIAVDPLVLYWNRDLLSANGYAQPPQYWDEIFGMAEKITRRDEAKNVTKSAIAFGEFRNVPNAKAILSALVLQAGGKITTLERSGKLTSALLIKQKDTLQPTQSALRFYTEFANPSKSVYTWNRSLPDARESFAAGDVALYVGFASEIPILEQQNPNLHFGVSVLPQIRGLERSRTFGRFYAFAVPRGSLNPGGAQVASFILASVGPSARLAEARSTPSAHRDVLKAIKGASSTPVTAILRDSALIAEGWLDPDPDATNNIFRGMIESVTSGASNLREAVDQGDKGMGEIIRE